MIKTTNGLRWYWRALDWWGRRERWWWILLITAFMVIFSYDLGRMVTRAELMTLGGPVVGSLDFDGIEKKAKEFGGGRLIITSPNSARFIDRSGAAWEVPAFGDRLNRERWRMLRERQVLIDGDIRMELSPVKTTPRDLLLSLLADMLIKLAFLGVIGLFVWMLVKSLNHAGQRFRRIGGANRPATRIGSIAGYEGQKKEVLEIIEYLRHPEVFKKVGARPLGGVLLYGPPGTGKTQLAKAIAGEADANFLEQSGSAFIQVYVGEGARAIRSLFAEARKNRPCVVFIDEIDAFGASRTQGGSHDERLQTLNALLTEMDGFSNNEGIVVVAATNRLEILDEALVRPGRFDRKVHIPLPTRSDRLAILKVHTEALPSMEVDLERWADQTQSMSGADLSNLVNEAAIEAARAKAEVVGDVHFSSARERVLLGARNFGQKPSENERRTIAIHELGHAVLRMKNGGRVEKVSILPRTRSLGVTLTVLDEDVLLQTPEGLRTELAVLMGGRAAEQELVGTVSSGAADDMERASVWAREAMRRYGWGDEVPYVPAHGDLQREGERHAARWVGEAYTQAKETVRAHRAELLLATEQLLAADELDGQQLVLLFADPPIPALPTAQ